MSVENILNSTREKSDFREIHNLNKARQKFSSQITQPDHQRFTSFAELGEHASEFNSIRQDLIMVEAYKKSASLAKFRLDAESLAIKNINEVIEQARIEIQRFETSPAISLENIANEALNNIRRILNQQINDLYLFGGVNSAKMPCQDLTLVANNNVVGNVITTNYTTALSNYMDIDVSNNHKVKLGIDASNQAFAQTIAAMNKLKLNTVDLEDVDNTLRYAKSLLEQLDMQNSQENKIIEDADKYNQLIQSAAEERMHSTFQVDIIEARDSAFNLAASLRLTIQLREKNMRLFERIIDDIR